MSMRTQVVRLFGAAALAIILAGCERANTPMPPPTAPSPSLSVPPPVPPPAGVTVSGTVLEFTATGEVRPVPNLRLKVRAGIRDGAVGSVELADTVTDAHGRYTITDVSASLLFFQTAPGSEYRFLCDAYPVLLRFPFTDLPVVHTAWSGIRPPPHMWIIATSVWGTVSERVNGGLQAVADATVSFADPTDPPATTSATGLYMICSIVGTDQDRTISVLKTGYNRVTREIVGGYESEFNFELTRK